MPIFERLLDGCFPCVVCGAKPEECSHNQKDIEREQRRWDREQLREFLRKRSKKSYSFRGVR